MSAKVPCLSCGKSFFTNNLKVHQAACQRKNSFLKVAQNDDINESYESYGSYESYDTDETIAQEVTSEPPASFEVALRTLSAKNATIIILKKYFHLNLEHRCKDIQSKNVFPTFLSVSAKYSQFFPSPSSSHFKSVSDISVVDREIIK